MRSESADNPHVAPMCVHVIFSCGNCSTSQLQHFCLLPHIGFDKLDTVPSSFVLMGNFQSQPATTASTDYAAIRDQFKSLAGIISQYHRLQVPSGLALASHWHPLQHLLLQEHYIW